MEVYHDHQVEEILIRFQNLRSKSARRAVYVYVCPPVASHLLTVRHRYLNILNELRVDERRELKNHIDKTSFHRDILGSLPLELAVQITSYLEIADLFNLQSVCIPTHHMHRAAR